jgi:glycosyltransferase involved in cell wall biosynthesis
MVAVLVRIRPSFCYVVDMAYSGLIAACLYRLISGCRVVVDTGDAISELAISMQRGAIGIALTRFLEWIGFHYATDIIVRSHYHQEHLAAKNIRTHVIPDGVDSAQFKPLRNSGLRRTLGLDNSTVIAVVGSLTWNKRLQICYGWDLVEVIRILRHEDCKGVIIGDGPGLEYLKKKCSEYNIEGRICFLGWIPYAQLPDYLGVADICISTQTNDLVGRVRTTGKLPLYLACGTFVLASDVGEASRLLPTIMRCRYDGEIDHSYPARLANRIRELIERPELLTSSKAISVNLAQRLFDYEILTDRLRKLFVELPRESTVG